jgi:type IV secretion system protein VirB9
MNPHRFSLRMAFVVAAVAQLTWASTAAAQARISAPTEARIREVIYDPVQVIVVPVKRGVSTHIQLEAGETIRFAAAGIGANCAKPDHPWCVVAEEGSGHVFVKPRELANGPNTLALVTERRSYSFEFVLVSGKQEPVLRLVVRPPRPPSVDPQELRTVYASQAAAAALATAPQPGELLHQRLSAPAPVRNARYSVATGSASNDIVPTIVFDDGRFTYLQFPNNREIPAAFQVNADGSESLVNMRMERDFLVIDRVSRGLMLRLGPAVVSVLNEAYDLDGQPPVAGTTAPGVERLVPSSAYADRRLP